MAGKRRGVGRPDGERAGFLVWLSGADPDTLARSPRERRKFSGLGGVVLTTSGMAAVSAGFALYNGVRAPLWAALPVAVLWGLAIANLDRWLIAAATRRDRWWENLATLVPRLLLAGVIGAVVSTPLVLWIFQSEIQAQLTLTQQAERAAFQTTLRDDARFAGIPQLEKDVDELQRVAAGAQPAGDLAGDPAVASAQAEFTRLDQQYQEAQKLAFAELDGSGGTGKQGAGSTYRQKLKVAQDLRKQRDTAKEKLDAARNAALGRDKAAAGGQQADARSDLPGKQAELARLKSLKAQEEDRYLIDSRNDRGLLAQIEALSTITDRDATLKTAYLTLLLFITAIEILPVLTKFLLNIGRPSAYDEILASAERADVEIAKANLERDRERREKEYAARSERQAEVDAELRDRRIARWRSDEIRRMRGQQVPPARPARWWSAILPGQRERRPADGGYDEWPDAENPAATPASITDRAGGGWRFRE
ncbi:DUF4407 domain-containing protein [Actinoplanes sp. G11-F43]|uniref:DUF4407 domain-containing protein n=1 Tax=Actinoplanes sp. G11-F43 TaxID=3424130 RepID=UPI003D33DE55